MTLSDLAKYSMTLEASRGFSAKAELLVSPYGSPIIVVYRHQTSSRNSDGVTPCGCAKYRWRI